MPPLDPATVEFCARVAEGWSVEAAGDCYQTCGNGNYWDAGTQYDQGRLDAGAHVRALLQANLTMPQIPPSHQG